jgi:hypothetical protein
LAVAVNRDPAVPECDLAGYKVDIRLAQAGDLAPTQACQDSDLEEGAESVLGAPLQEDPDMFHSTHRDQLGCKRVGVGTPGVG